MNCGTFILWGFFFAVGYLFGWYQGRAYRRRNRGGE